MSNAAPPFHPPLVNRPHVKICGLRRVKDALLAGELGATFLGVVLTSKSPRMASLDEARAIRRAMDQAARLSTRGKLTPQLVGVFTDEPAEVIMRALIEVPLDWVQIHRDWRVQAGGPPSLVHLLDTKRVIPAIAVRDREPIIAALELDAAHPAVVLDAFNPTAAGGTGRTFDHMLAAPVIGKRRTFVAGGLNTQNIASVLATLRTIHAVPYGFDLSSGVESAPGEKDHVRMRAFFTTLSTLAR